MKKKCKKIEKSYVAEPGQYGVEYWVYGEFSKIRLNPSPENLAILKSLDSIIDYLNIRQN
jgi:hypothetical protein